MSASADATSPAQTDDDDATLLKKADELFAEERLLNAADLLEQVEDKSLLEQEKYQMMLTWAKAVRTGMKDLLQDPEVKDDEDFRRIPWKKQSEAHGYRDFFVYYHATDDNKLVSRIDCAIESSLLIPILAVFNESDLYSTWMPSWKKPSRRSTRNKSCTVGSIKGLP